MVYSIFLRSCGDDGDDDKTKMFTSGDNDDGGDR